MKTSSYFVPYDAWRFKPCKMNKEKKVKAEATVFSPFNSLMDQNRAIGHI